MWSYVVVAVEWVEGIVLLCEMVWLRTDEKEQCVESYSQAQEESCVSSVTQSFEVVRAPWDIEKASGSNPMPCVPPRCHSCIMPGQNLQTRDERDSLVDPILRPRD